MFGIFLAGLSSAFDELADSIGKKRVGDGSESYYTFGFLTQFLSALFICITGFLFHDLSLSNASLATFIPRVLIAILEMQLAVIAIANVDRGNFGFVRLATLPLLLVIDLLLGYAITGWQFLGVFLIIASIVFLFLLDSLKKKGLWIVLVVAILASFDISLYKYDISHFNSVESEQAVISLILSLYFFLTATLIKRENPLLFLRKPIYCTQATASGLAYVVNSFAYLFAPASVITTAFRGFSVLFSILTGRFYFKEKSFVIRVVLFIIILIGLLLLI